MSKSDLTAIGGLLLQTWGVVKKSRRAILVAMLFYGAIGVAIHLLVIAFVGSVGVNVWQDVWAKSLLEIIGLGLITFFVGASGFFLICLGLSWSTMMVIKITKNALAGQETDIEALVQECGKEFMGVFTTSLVTSFFTFLWSILLVIPGIYKSIQWAFAIIIATLTDKKNTLAMASSKTLVNGRRRKTLGYCAVMRAIIFLVGRLLHPVLSCISLRGIGEVLPFIVQIMLSGIGVVYMTLLFLKWEKTSEQISP